MPTVLMLAGSPSAVSRSSAVLQYVHAQLTHDFITVESLHVRRLDASELLWANSKGATIEPALAQVERADGIVLACPTYKAAYSGILKTFLDLLPQRAFQNKVILPIMTGGSAAHTLVIDYALKPVLSAMGDPRVLRGIYLLDGQIDHSQPEQVRFTDDDIKHRLDKEIEHFLQALQVMI